jgi:hypothetical protein
MVGVVCAVTCLRVANLVGQIELAQHDYEISLRMRILGFWRTIRGVLLMSFLRLPRKDFFQQSPVFSWLLPLALCVLLHVVIEQPVLRWLIPAVLVQFLLPYWLDMIVPPTWIFLGKSNFDSFVAFERMRRQWRQHGLTLLDRVGQEGTEFYSAWRTLMRLAEMRTTAPAGREVVPRLMMLDNGQIRVI